MIRFLVILYVFSWLLFVGCSNKEESDLEPDYDFVVDKDGTGDFISVQEAFDAVKFYQEERTIIFIRNGVYKEVLNLPAGKNKVTIIGESAADVILTYDNYAAKINTETGTEYGTSGSSSTYIYGDDFYAKNVTFENSAGPVGQALAIYINGDRAIFSGCRFLGNQDTMYGGRSRQYFKNCYIEGTTDFIFGPATAFFESCEIYSNGGSAITAASTEEYVDYGYVFRNCKISGSGPNITSLGRPWRPYAAVAFLNCKMSSCIKPEGWDNWGNTENEATARYAEYQSTGEGAHPEERVTWARQLTSSEAADFTVKNIFKTTYANPAATDNWNPESVIAATNEFLDQH